MIQQLLALLPTDIHPLALVIAISGAFLGGLLWLGGSRFNRTLMTLLSVSAGALIGLQLPVWFHWGLEGWATATLGAIALGISGYALHKVWAGLGLGLVLACWASLAVFFATGEARGFVWPVTTGPSGTIQAYLADLWSALTPDTRRLLPFAWAAAMLWGIAASVIWPRLGIVLLYSTAGISLLVGMGTLALNSAKREWLALIPSQTSAQVVVLLSAVAFGAVLQWRTAPRVMSSMHRHSV
ncbi:MAG TPA: hypothetical protein VH475_15145 [Tepidisphaeraceae bacterium]|jgi:hypothetical protein